MKKIFFISMLLLIMVIPSSCFAMNEVNVYFFHSKDCNICEQERVYLQALKKDRYPNMRIYAYEIGTQTNYDLMERAKKLYNESRTGVPFTIVGDKVFYGFSQGSKSQIQQAVYNYSINSYQNKLGNELGISYSKDLQGEVKQYNEKADYVVEETSGIERKPSEPANKKFEFNKYRNSIILISAGLILFIIYLILKIRERRRYR